MLAYSILHWWQPPLLQAVRTMVFDFYVAQKPRPYDPNLPVRIVDIDDESLTRLGQWPWPRTRMAEIVRRLEEYGALAIGFDVLFAEPDRTSPASIAESLPNLDPETRERLQAMPSIASAKTA
ncbi:MAG TPA: adenylate/guanylate cyclase domain-containing protein, partial [Alphaproteobacteria bacterium]|nr:adenylate/guanylate cyclase domain-containing protein [Alphaproteobacteria bacterium]